MDKRKTIVVIILGVLITGGLIGYKSAQTKFQDKEKNSQDKKSVKVVEIADKYENVISYRGIVKGATEVHLAPKAQGRVTHIYKEVGETVYKGQLLATIDGSELWAQTNVAKTGFDSAKSASKKTEKFFDKQVSQAKKGRELAKDAYEMAQQSGDQEKIAQTKANYEMAKKAVSVAKKGRDLQVKMAKGQRDVAGSQVIAAQTMASNTQLRAPFSGVIAQSNVEVGSLVSPQVPMFLLVGNTGEEVEISVASEQLTDLKVGQEVKVKSDDNKEVQAKILAISPMVDTHTRKGLVKISLPKNSPFTLGEYVSVLLPGEDIANFVTIPRQALVRMYHDTFVFTIKDNVVHRQIVETGEDLGDNVVIVDGLKIGDEIVIEGQQYLSDGQVVTIIK